MKTASQCRSRVASGSALIKYKGSTDEIPPASLAGYISDSKNEIFMTTDPANTCENPDKVCITEVTSMRKMPKSLADPIVDVKMYLPINYKIQGFEFSGWL